jgi:tetratricopeptide (TPR) repeat protein
VRRVAFLGIVLTVAMSATGQGQTLKTPDPERQAALALEQRGNSADAEAAWHAYLKAHPSSPEAYAHLGLLEARQEHYKEAVPLYRKALKLGPAVPGLRLNLGLALFKGGDLKGAIQEFTALLKSQPGNQQATTLVGMAHYGLAEYAEAVPYLRQAVSQDTQSLPLRLALAHSCLWSKQNQCVLDVYKEILALNPDSAEADMLAGEALDEMKDNEGSTKMFRAAVKAGPKTPNAHFGLGYLLWTQKQYKEAASEFQAELANDPDHVQARLYLADTDIQLNQMDDALPLLERVEKQNPSIALDRLDLGIVYTETGRKEDALRELTAAEKLTPGDVNVHWRLGRLYRALGKTDEAKAEFEKAGKLNKAADEDLYKKIANGNARPPESQEPAATTPQQ